MRKLRFALLSLHTCPLTRLGGRDAGGMNVYVRELATQLGKLGHSVDVFTRRHNSDHEDIMTMGHNARLIHLAAGDINGTDKAGLYAHLPDFTRRIEDFRQSEGGHYNVIYAHYWLSGLVGKLLHEWWNVPNLTMFHTLGIIKNMIVGGDEPAVRIESEKFLARDSTRVVASTHREQEFLCASFGAGADKTTVIPCGVNLDLFHPIDKQEARAQTGLGEGRIVLFIGRIEALKGLDRLIEAVPRLEIPDLRLVITGGDEYSRDELAKLESLAAKLAVRDRVSFLPPMPQEQLPAYYSAADVFVLPSHYESFGMVALEALACGTPVVATPVGDLGRIIRRGVTGYIAADNSPDELARKIGLALGRGGFASPERIHASVARYGWDRIAREVVVEAERLIGVRPVPAHHTEKARV